MSIIKILQPDQAQKIAAGEVIERPCNVVKELIENSIDAKATQISLFIEDAGKALIRIVDNGSGMTPEDAQLCFLPHATSKITNLDDIENIASFGFRGEALASISAISKVILITKPNQYPGGDVGVKVEFADGKIQKTQSIACNAGTDIQIHNLFYNTPVRKKFLKQDETEWNQIQTIFHAFCLSHIDVHFKLFRDNKMILNAPAVAQAKDRVSQIWGNGVSQNLLELKSKKNDADWIEFSGYVSNHNFWRYGKTHIFLFVNNRWVKNAELSKAVFKGYLNVLPPDKFPAAFIFVSVSGAFVDINCHPKKEEVRFLKPLAVQVALQESIKFTLESNVIGLLAEKGAPDRKIENSANFGENFSGYGDKIFDSNFCEIKSSIQNFPKLDNANFIIPQMNTNSAQRYNKTEVTCAQVKIDLTCSDNINLMWQNYKIIGQLFNTYIIIENDEDFIMIDQHAAHERILYEKMLKSFEKKDGVRLIAPEVLTLASYQIRLLIEQQEFLQNQGIDIEVFGESEVVIKSGPAGLTQASIQELIFQIISFVQENEYFDQEVFRKKLNEHVHSHLACKLAIKAGDKLSSEMMQGLIDDLRRTEKCFICVHGRPTTWVIKKYDIEKNFRRK